MSAPAEGAGALDRFFAPQPQHAMVVARIGFGAILASYYLSRLPWVQVFWGPEGIGGAATHARVPGLRAGRPLEEALQWLHLVDSSLPIGVLYGLMVLAALAFLVGAWTRVAGVLLLVLHALFHARNPHAYLGWAALIKPFLLYATLAPSGRFLSVDAWRAGRPLVPPMAQWMGPGIPVRLAQVHLCAVYAVAGWVRLGELSWWQGKIVFVSLTDRFYGRLDWDWHPWKPVLALLTWATFVLEPVAPVLLWMRRVGVVWALLLLGFHAGLELFANFGYWSHLMMVALCVFLPPAWLHWAFERLVPPRQRAAGADV